MSHSPLPQPLQLATRTFTPQDQADFAELSLDWNPMHVDAVAARRLLSGRQVVHGIHTLLQAISLWQAPTGQGALKVHCNFAQPVNVGDRVVFSQFDDGDGRSRITASVEGLACTELTLGRLTEPVPAAPAPNALPLRRLQHLSAPLDETPGSQAATAFELVSPPPALAARFPQAALLLGAQGLAAVAQLSCFVGMVCPGLHSVFSSTQFSVTDNPGAPLRFEVRKYDPRFRLFIVAFDGPLRGELRAFLRPPPQPQASAREVAAQLHGDEFKGRHSLVIGGSRGLGETTAKILAGGGGDVTISFAAGRDDAQAVAADINAQGRGHCEAVQLDLQGDYRKAVDTSRIDAVYFFSTPRIYSKRSALFERRAFDEFVDFYLQRFHELCLWLDSAERPIRVYLPSTVFITERPKGMTEYAMAKAAAEVLADDLNRSLNNVRIVHTRLPRLATDQTASILKVEVASNVDAMLAVVRRMHE